MEGARCHWILLEIRRGDWVDVEPIHSFPCQDDVVGVVSLGAVPDHVRLGKGLLSFGDSCSGVPVDGVGSVGSFSLDAVLLIRTCDRHCVDRWSPGSDVEPIGQGSGSFDEH